MFWEPAGGTLGYLGLFLFGLHFMSRCLSEGAGSLLKRLLARMTVTPGRGFLAGVMVTAFLQSSSLTSVMVVGLVNAGMISLVRGIPVIIGANVGTTVTAQLLSFNLFLLALPLSGFASLIYLLMPRLRRAAGAGLGFGLVLLGLKGMAETLAPLQEAPFFSALLLSAGAPPWKGAAAGLFLAAALQSSSAVMGMVLAMALEGSVSLPAAVAVLIGADLGTCTTALIASLGMSRAARAAAWFHFLFNLVSLCLALLFFPSLLRLAEVTAAALPRRLANFHTLYNCLGAAVLLPLVSLWGRLGGEK